MGITDESDAHQHQGGPGGERAQPSFIGRTDIKDQVQAYLERGIPFSMQTVGTWGIGKSSLLDWVDKRARGKATVFGPIRGSLYADALGSASERDAQEPAPVTSMAENFRQYVLLLKNLIDFDSQQPGLQNLGLKVEEARNKVSRVVTPSTTLFDTQGRRSLVPDGRPANNETVELAINYWVSELRRTLQEELEKIARNNGAIVLIDELNRLRGYDLHRWVIELVTGLSQPVVIAASREPEDFRGQLELMRLKSFTHDEVRDFLNARLGRDEAPSLVTRVLDFSRGLPQAVAMAADLIDRRRQSGGQEDLADVPSDVSTPITTTLLAAIVAELPSEDVRRVLREGRFARRIDVDVVHYLLFRTIRSEDAADHQARSSNAWMAVLNDYSFFEEVSAGPTDPLGKWRFHTYLSAKAPADATFNVNEQLVHEKLAEYYQRRLEDYDEERADPSVYMNWYKYEQDEWQALMLEWLHHAAQLEGREDRVAARLEFARVFLDLFWWWGCYVDYPFCERLLDDWDRTQPPEERAASGLMRTIYEQYPRGHTKQSPEGWQKTRAALEKLQVVLGVDGAVPRPSATAEGVQQKRAQARSYVRAFTSLFLAHSYRYRPDMRKGAIGPYRDALKYLKATEDSTAVAWTTFELADLWFELGDLAQARTGLVEAARLHAEARAGGEDDDLELLANLHRLDGDLLEANGDSWEAVLAATGRAVVRAYAYLNWPNPPDPYTVAFYGEMRERAARRMIAMNLRQSADTAARGRAVETFASQLAEVLPVDTAAVQEILGRTGNTEDEAIGTGLLQSSLTPSPPSEFGNEARSDEFVISSGLALERVTNDRAADLVLSQLPENGSAR